MKQLLNGIALSAFLLATPAIAADLPARVPVRAPVVVATMYNWSGFYIGGHAGGGWRDISWTFPSGTTVSTDQDGTGFIGGIHTGVNWQFNQIVIGLEGALSFDRIDHTSVCNVTAWRCESEVDHFWRAGARVGFAAGATGNWLIYGTGGFARAKVNSQIFLAATGASLNVSGDTHHAGWYAGAGVDWAISPNFILGLEAYRMSFGGERHWSPAGVTVHSRDVELDQTVVQARATYKFGGWWR